jgi:hypothetical protein
MELSTLAILLGCVVCLPQIYGLAKPARFMESVRQFPRSLPWGIALTLIGTAWFLFYVYHEKNADFARFKMFLLPGFGAIGILTCIYVQDFLAVRGLAVVFLVLAKLILDTQRWVETDWRYVMTVWAYVLVLAGIWFTVSPWRLRDLLNWATATESRVRVGCRLRLAFGLFVMVLGLTAYR